MISQSRNTLLNFLTVRKFGIYWFFFHIDIPGKELVDRAALMAATSRKLGKPLDLSYPQTFKRDITITTPSLRMLSAILQKDSRGV